ncbi:endonuclease/exonuclease/phosphatase family protein [Nocardia sp. 2]|uniref:Endonuclease/exonuclease/phosphatase family protein n=1 Tax=Nocardia acididurans TaxID=2802282 RepID=A0ABS1M0M3_9NOCA|nr:endonuclease/exonuclease/phosphatase family protein [Nocardia acididurans]MBL1074217.1 endonuclease/exonuclease/phosphatase family protein [Nocardia acididurans]
MNDSATRPRARSRTAWVFAAAALVLTLLLLRHDLVPDVLGLGVAVDTAAPWLGLLIPVLAVLCRSPLGAVTTLLPLLVWANAFGGWWAPALESRAPSSGGGITVVSQNLFADNTSPAATARAVLAADADLVAVQEFAAADRVPVQRALDATYPYREQIGTVALWSRYPTSGATAVDVGLAWKRGLRTHVATPAGDLVVYVVHLPSIRPADTGTRTHGLAVLSQALAADPAEHIVVAGDFNTASTDRHWLSFAPGYRDAQRQSGSGPGFTWPAAAPIVRLDHVLTHGLTATRAGVLRVPGTDHRAVTATVEFDR